MRLMIAVLLLLPTWVHAQEPPPPALVSVAKVMERQVAPTAELIGAVDFDQIAGISSEISGLIASQHLHEGAVVSSGKVLVELVTDFIQNDIALLDQRKALLDVRMGNTQKNLKRFATLFQQEATSEKEYDDLAFELKELQVQKASLDVEKQKKKLELKKSRIRAPFKGLVIERMKNRGEWVSPGVPICSLANVGSAMVQVAVSENLIRYMTPGKTVPVQVGPLGKTLAGKVRAAAPRIDPKSKTFFLKIDIPYEEGLLQNMSATVNVATGHSRNMRMIKRDALVRFQGKDLVYTVVDGKAKMLPIQILATDGEYVAVDAPYVQAGMSVVVEGNERLRPGQPVKVVSKDSSPKAQ